MRNCYWFIKYNTLKLKYDILEQQISKEVKKAIEEQIENRISVEWYKRKNQLLRKQLKELSKGLNKNDKQQKNRI